MRTSKNALSFALLALVCFALVPSIASAAANIVIINIDGAGEGFNDPTAAAPVGGNPGTTVGAQRLNAFQYAASVWGATLDSNVTIRIRGAFNPLACTATGAVLGSAGTRFVTANDAPIAPWPGLEPNTWYGTALANKRVGYDTVPGPTSDDDDINAQFNTNLGVPGCLTGIFWYYGFDGNHGGNIDLVTVLLHEFGHGLNFQQFASVTTGALLNGPPVLPDVFNKRILDTTSGKTWDQMTNAERVASAINTRRVVWTGPNVAAAVPTALSFGVPILKFTTPASLTPDQVGTASFGAALTAAGVTGDVVLATDAIGSTTDGCDTQSNSLTGKIALVDRGTCGFVVKAKIVQDAGAIGMIVVNNVAGAPAGGMSGADPTVTIPSVMITLADGNALKTALTQGTVNATMLLDTTVRAGTEPVSGKAMLYTPNPVQSGSTISHWDTQDFPNQLMEPAINGDLTHSVKLPEDMTLALLRDVGWFPDSNVNGVPDGSELTALSPAEIWLGLKNSDDVGTNFDLKVEVLKNGSVIGSGESLNVPGGGSGFSKAVQRSVNLAITAPGTTLSTGDSLSIKVYARIGATGHRSGTARLWFNDAAADTEFDTTIGGVNQDWYIRAAGGLQDSPGAGPRTSIDLTLDRLVGGNPYKLFGTWTHTF